MVLALVVGVAVGDGLCRLLAGAAALDAHRDAGARQGEVGHGALGQGRDKSSYVFSLSDQPGALLKALEPFSRRSINLTKIESRPSKKKVWDYYFFADIVGHHEDPVVREAITELEACCPFVKWLGSYPNVRV